MTSVTSFMHILKHRPLRGFLTFPETRNTLPRCQFLMSARKQTTVTTSDDKSLTGSAGSAVPAKASKSDKEPFAKNLFIGKFDPTFLEYPEVLSKEKLATMDEMVETVSRFFEEKVDSKKIDADAVIPKETLDGLKDLGLFGQQVPPEYGGLGLTATEYARLGEIIALDGAIAVTLAAHQAIGLKGILIAGTEEQKKKYLPRLASGEWIAAFCLTEPNSGSDAASIQTHATLGRDGKTWYLNGSKIWISNGGLADVFTVFAKTPADLHKVGKPEKVTAFIVERNFGGVTSGKPEDKLGIRGSNTAEVNFDNTPVPPENIIGELGDGFKLAMNILNSGRYSMGSAGAGVLKRAIRQTVDHAINRVQFGRPLMEFQLIQEKIARMAVTVYAMESMAYLTAGMIDETENADCSVEAAIVKVFSSEGCWECANECLQVLGGQGYMKDFPFERYLRDSRIMMIFEGTNEILRLFIALNGLQWAGRFLAEVVRKVRNPFMYPGFTLQKMYESRRQAADNPKLNLGLDGYLHPALTNPSKSLEYCVLRLQYVVELVLQQYGKNVTEEQMDLKKLANIAIDIYAMTAVLGRASRSYCIGLRNADHEMMLAAIFCREAYLRVKQIAQEIEDGPNGTTDADIRKIAKTLIQQKGYCAEHPLTRNF